MAIATTRRARRVLTALGLTLALTMFVVPATHPVAGQDSRPGATLVPASHPLIKSTRPIPPQPDGASPQDAPPAPTEKSGAKISRHLADLASEYEGYEQQGSGEGFRPSNPLVPAYDDRVVIDATSSGDANELKAALEEPGQRQLLDRQCCYHGEPLHNSCVAGLTEKAARVWSNRDLPL